MTNVRQFKGLINCMALISGQSEGDGAAGRENEGEAATRSSGGGR